VSKYSDDIMDWLVEAGFTHCFYVAGGNAMHLIESASYRFKAIPFLHEAGAGIAADYFNETCGKSERAFVIVTAGPGLTNLVTPIAGAWLDRRELLVLGGQAKSSDLNNGRTRQVGFQEIGGVEICSSITKASVLIDKQISRMEFERYIQLSKAAPKGPVFLEICLDVSAEDTRVQKIPLEPENRMGHTLNDDQFEKIFEEICNSERPLIVLGGALDRESDIEKIIELTKKGFPLATTFNGTDRIGSEYEYYCGHPNWYGSRWANLIIQQSDLVIYLGESVGIQGTGYNIPEFLPLGKLIQIDLDQKEIDKGFPHNAENFVVDPSDFLSRLTHKLNEVKFELDVKWLDLIKLIRGGLGGVENSNVAQDGFIEYYSFIFDLISRSSSDDLISPCSSGQSYESLGRVIPNKQGQKILASPGLASMGYGISAAIGMSLANPGRRTLSLEGDGGFSQNLQELGVVKSENLNIKLFIGSNKGYGSIRNNQKSAFNGHYLGCDRETGLWLPDWRCIAEAFGIESFTVTPENKFGVEFMELLNSEKPVLFVVELDPNQVFFPRIISSRDKSGVVKSNPLHLMEPPLSEEDFQLYAPFLSSLN
jgi:acetolactate synthase-1/2/3 large subunit